MTRLIVWLRRAYLRNVIKDLAFRERELERLCVESRQRTREMTDTRWLAFEAYAQDIEDLGDVRARLVEARKQLAKLQ